ncbi:hypothetical protein PTSG_02354 [Salpingoeca rosetta]|uniref:Uncharacterized protein n=1 Tax=Salpingoeca rosetta (strain ATCC 50818 / BSB-021) TaxID=946362 RepID=F2U1Y6_SALR5|nr:uncharacterized protein PTSG_02354 [Salpingoeca rosetta]EGD81638.1 hypothetical protein PTSG_02354 [Salpingoeca rosetta]|eukprot:XP_004996842.1 hypothetical protein PTSG_02354 [Salpingoeca rosetta]
MKLTFALVAAAAILACATAQDIFGVWTGPVSPGSDCSILGEFRETSFFTIISGEESSGCASGIFIGSLTVTSPASGSSADTSIIITYVEVPDFATDQISPGDTFVFDIYLSGDTMTLRNDYFETQGLWPTGGLVLTTYPAWPINGYWDGNDTSLLYINNGLYLRASAFGEGGEGSSAGVVEMTGNTDEYMSRIVGSVSDIEGDTYTFTMPSSGDTRLLDFSDPADMNGFLLTKNEDDEFNGIYYGVSPAQGEDCMQSTDFNNGIFRAFRFQCDDSISDDGLRVSAYIGRYTVSGNQMRLLYTYAAPDDDLAGAEVVFTYTRSGRQLTLTGSVGGSDEFTITMNRADRAPAATVVNITVSGDVNTFDADAFLAGLAQVLDIPVNTIEVVSISPGSVVVVVAIREDASDSSAPSLSTIIKRIEAVPAGTSIGGYGLESAQASRDPGSTSAASVATTSWFAAAILFMAVVSQLLA